MKKTVLLEQKFTKSGWSIIVKNLDVSYGYFFGRNIR